MTQRFSTLEELTATRIAPNMTIESTCMPVVIRSQQGTRGFVGITSALVITGMLAFTGLAFDVGYLEWARMSTQAAADAAAMGALRELELGHSTTIATAGLNDASLNGFTNGVNNTTVTINNPPLSGSYQGNSSAVEALVSRTVPIFFMMIVGANSVSISARAVAQTTSSGGSIGGCIFALDPTASRSLQIAGSTSTTTAGSVIVDSSNSQAFEMEGSETFYLQNHSKVAVYGNWQLNGQTGLWDTVSNAKTNLYRSLRESPIPWRRFPCHPPVRW